MFCACKIERILYKYLINSIIIISIKLLNIKILNINGKLLRLLKDFTYPN